MINIQLIISEVSGQAKELVGGIRDINQWVGILINRFSIPVNPDFCKIYPVC
jgi:hypothetical protein